MRSFKSMVAQNYYHGNPNGSELSFRDDMKFVTERNASSKYLRSAIQASFYDALSWKPKLIKNTAGTRIT